MNLTVRAQVPQLLPHVGRPGWHGVRPRKNISFTKIERMSNWGNHTLQNFLTGRKIYRKAVFVLRAFNLVGEYNEVGGSYFNGNDVLDEKELIGLMYL